jgi:hypothetical protein
MSLRAALRPRRACAAKAPERRPLGALLLLAVVLGAAACSSGRLDDAHDRYLSLFGLAFTPPPPHHGGILARVVDADGHGAPWVAIEARRATGDAATTSGEPIRAVTNGRGGFYLGALDPGDYVVFATAPGGFGAVLAVAVAEDAVFEETDLALSPLARVRGHVALENEPSLSGTAVSILGTSFSAVTDYAGFFAIDVPAGRYRLHAEKTGFLAVDTEAIDVAAVTTRDLALAANPWPSAGVQFDSPDGYVVHGLETRLRLTPVPGVRTMVVDILDGAERIVAASTLRGRHPIATELVVQHSAPGATMLAITFEDGTGKRSDTPARVSYYNTNLDASWTLLHGAYQRPVLVRAGTKVAFLGGPFGDKVAIASAASSRDEATAAVDAPVPAPQPTAAPMPDAPVVIGGGGEGHTDAQPGVVGDATTFYAPVTIEAGAVVAGAARFVGGLAVNGTKDAPVTWQGGVDGAPRESIDVANGPVQIAYARFDGVYVVSYGSSLPSFELTDSTFADAGVSLLRYAFASGATSRVSVAHCRFTNAGLQLGPFETSGNAPAPNPRPLETSLAIRLEGNVLEGTTLALSDLGKAQGLATSLTLRDNDFVGLASGQFYFSTSIPTGGAVSPLPPATEVAYDAAGNFFQEPARLYQGFDPAQWPSAQLGEARPQPSGTAGPR